MIKNWKTFNRVNEEAIYENGKQYIIVSLNDNIASIIRINSEDTAEDIKFLVIESIQSEEGYSEIEFEITDDDISDGIDYPYKGTVDASVINIHLTSKNLYGIY